jgi:CRP-like cAMP-binding protein
MSIEDDIRFLDRIPFFKVLGGDALRNLAIGAQTLNVGPGAVVFSANEHAESAYGVVRGRLDLTDRTGKPAGAIEAGAVAGDTCLLTPTVWGLTATAPEGATLLVLPRHLFLRMLEGFPASAVALRDFIAARADLFIRDLDRVRLQLAVQAMQDEVPVRGRG